VEGGAGQVASALKEELEKGWRAGRREMTRMDEDELRDRDKKGKETSFLIFSNAH
jgi:hypothetical protein